jgi:hypothetical protein
MDYKLVTFIIIGIFIFAIVYFKREHFTSNLITCEDLNTNCKDFADRGECSVNIGYMLDNCPNSCGFCNTPINTSNNIHAHDCVISSAMKDSCFDLSPLCSIYAESTNGGNCDKNPGYMNTFCKKTCSKCTTNNYNSDVLSCATSATSYAN